MKKKTIALLAAMAILSATTGCATKQSGNINLTPNGMTYESGSVGTFPSSPASATEMSRAYARMKMAEGACGEGQGVTPTTNKLVIGIVNNDPNANLYLYNPEFPGVRIELEPQGGYAFVEVTELPRELVIYRDDRVVATYHPHKDYYQGRHTGNPVIGKRKVKIKYTINKVY
jgi:hypothetical protein